MLCDISALMQMYSPAMVMITTQVTCRRYHERLVGSDSYSQHPNRWKPCSDNVKSRHNLCRPTMIQNRRALEGEREREREQRNGR